MIVDARPIHSDLVPEPVEWAGPRACREAHFHSVLYVILSQCKKKLNFFRGSFQRIR